MGSVMYLRENNMLVIIKSNSMVYCRYSYTAPKSHQASFFNTRFVTYVYYTRDVYLTPSRVRVK